MVSDEKLMERAKRWTNAVRAYVLENPGSEFGQIRKATRIRAAVLLEILARMTHDTVELYQHGVRYYHFDDPNGPRFRSNHSPLRMPNLETQLRQCVHEENPAHSLGEGRLLQLAKWRAIPAKDRTPGQQRQLDLADHQARAHARLVRYANQLIEASK